MSHKIRLVTSFNPTSPLISNSDSELHFRPTAGTTDPHRSTTPPGEYTGNSMVDENRVYPPGTNPSTINHNQNSSPNEYIHQETSSDVPRVFGFPLKYVSLVTLALQNASLAVIMHYSRVSVPSDKLYSAASAVLVNEILKGSISFAIAFVRLKPTYDGYEPILNGSSLHSPIYKPQTQSYLSRFQTLFRQIASPDSWKLSIPAILYVLQNNLQFIAVSNLDVPTFQVTNQIKILTTAAFSVLLLKKRLTGWKWASLALLAVGVGIVQIQASASVDPHHDASKPMVEIGDTLSGGGGDTIESLPATLHPIRGFLAVTAACFTSGLAGVYFEMVLKGSSADLWVRNVQLSMWSLIPALFPVVVGLVYDGQGIGDMFKNFGGWAWITVLTQVFGGLVTALVIKYSDNILKGFATSLSIILSFLASVALFNHQVTSSFVIGAAIVLGSTWMYNAPDKKPSVPPIHLDNTQEGALINGTTVDSPINRRPHIGERSNTDANDTLGSALDSPMEPHEPLLGYPNGNSSRRGHESKGSITGLISNLIVPRVGSNSADEKETEKERGYEMEVRSAGSSSNG